MTPSERWKFMEGYYVGVISVFVVLWIAEKLNLVGVDGVCIGVNTLVVAGGPLHGDLNRHGLFVVLGLD